MEWNEFLKVIQLKQITEHSLNISQLQLPFAYLFHDAYVLHATKPTIVL